MTTYMISIIVAGVMILIAAIIALAIQFEGGANPKDKSKRKIWFWVMAIINPVAYFILASFVLAPNAEDDQMLYDEYMAIVPIATAVGFVVYIIIGFVMAKIFKHGKIGTWF